MTLEPGTKLGLYEIVSLLGVGGMGEVYRARDTKLGREVAIKVLPEDVAQDAERLARFEREARVLASLNHGNIATLYGFEVEGETQFIVMELVEGETLADRITKGPIPLDQAIPLFLQIAVGLEAAHEKGIIHRDLKPANIKVTDDGAIKILDFGLAKAMAAGESSASGASASMSPTLTLAATQRGEILGTAAYMSPEQAKGEPTDPRSDIFSLGIIFYELLTGALPFEADTPYGMIIKRTLEKAPPPITLDPDIPEHMNRIVVRCLETEPELRYQNVREILQDLESRSGPRDHSVTQTLPLVLRKTSKSTLWAAAAAAVVLVGLGALWATGRLSFGGASTPAAGSAVVAPTADAMALAILPFRNASGDPSLDWLGTSLAEMLRSDVGQSAELRTISVDRISQILGDLKLDSGSTFDRATITQLGTFSNADKILVGQYVKVGDQIRIDARLHDVELGTETSLSATAPTESDLLTAVGDLAATVRAMIAVRAESANS